MSTTSCSFVNAYWSHRNVFSFTWAVTQHTERSQYTSTKRPTDRVWQFWKFLGQTMPFTFSYNVYWDRTQNTPHARQTRNEHNYHLRLGYNATGERHANWLLIVLIFFFSDWEWKKKSFNFNYVELDIFLVFDNWVNIPNECRMITMINSGPQIQCEIKLLLVSQKALITIRVRFVYFGIVMIFNIFNVCGVPTFRFVCDDGQRSTDKMFIVCTRTRLRCRRMCKNFSE